MAGGVIRCALPLGKVTWHPNGPHRDMATGSGDDDWSSIAQNALRLEGDGGRRLRLASERRGRRRGDPGDRDAR